MVHEKISRKCVWVFSLRPVSLSRAFCISLGDDLFEKVLLDEESLNIDMVWEVIDWYKQVRNIL